MLIQEPRKKPTTKQAVEKQLITQQQGRVFALNKLLQNQKWTIISSSITWIYKTRLQCTIHVPIRYFNSRRGGISKESLPSDKENLQFCDWLIAIQTRQDKSTKFALAVLAFQSPIQARRTWRCPFLALMMFLTLSGSSHVGYINGYK